VIFLALVNIPFIISTFPLFRIKFLFFGLWTFWIGLSLIEKSPISELIFWTVCFIADLTVLILSLNSMYLAESMFQLLVSSTIWSQLLCFTVFRVEEDRFSSKIITHLPVLSLQLVFTLAWGIGDIEIFKLPHLICQVRLDCVWSLQYPPQSLFISQSLYLVLWAFWMSWLFSPILQLMFPGSQSTHF